MEVRRLEGAEIRTRAGAWIDAWAGGSGDGNGEVWCSGQRQAGMPTARAGATATGTASSSNSSDGGGKAAEYLDGREGEGEGEGESQVRRPTMVVRSARRRWRGEECRPPRVACRCCPRKGVQPRCAACRLCAAGAAWQTSCMRAGRCTAAGSARRRCCRCMLRVMRDAHTGLSRVSAQP